MVQLKVLILQSGAFKPLQKKREDDVMNILPVKPQMVEKKTYKTCKYDIYVSYIKR